MGIYGTGWWLTYPLKNMSSSVGMILLNTWENKKCSKPPTRVRMEIFYEFLLRC
jgi:hypothetical protein